MNESDPSDLKGTAASVDHCFRIIRQMLLDKAPPLVVTLDGPTVVEIRTPENPGKDSVLFARLSKGADTVNMQAIAVGADMVGSHTLSKRIDACRRGKSQFVFSGLDEELRRDIEDLLYFRFSICQARRLV